MQGHHQTIKAQVVESPYLMSLWERRGGGRIGQPPMTRHGVSACSEKTAKMDVEEVVAVEYVLNAPVGTCWSLED